MYTRPAVIYLDFDWNILVIAHIHLRLFYLCVNQQRKQGAFRMHSFQVGTTSFQPDRSFRFHIECNLESDKNARLYIEGKFARAKTKKQRTTQIQLRMSRLRRTLTPLRKTFTTDKAYTFIECRPYVRVPGVYLHPLMLTSASANVRFC